MGSNKEIPKMSRNENLPLDFPKIPPEKGIGKFLASKATTKSLLYPEHKYKTRDSSGMQTMFSLNALKEIDDILEHKRNDLADLEQMRKLQIDSLIHRETALKESFMKYERFIKENREKRERARQKIISEKILISKRNNEIQDLQENYKKLLEIKTLFENQIRSIRMYEDYLNEVVLISKENFKNAEDFLRRYHDLLDNREELARKETIDIEILHKAKNDLAKSVKRKSLTLVGLKNTENTLAHRYKSAHDKAMQWEGIVQQIQKFCSNERMKHNQLTSGIREMYLRFCRRKKISPKINADDVESQLKFIKKTFMEMNSVERKIFGHLNRYDSLML